STFAKASADKEDERVVIKLQKTIKKVTEDINNIKMNTAIAAMMEFLNAWENNPQGLSKENAKKFLQILAPFAPFLTEEIWHKVFDEKQSIHLSTWPKVEEKIIEEELVIPVQVNGKLRSTLRVSRHEISKDIVVNKALEDEKVKKYVEGKKYKIIYVQGKILNFIVK
ncbi:MAG: class I tRNA ligase family protein, partial [Candidatus Roizmanbacteria bacterium]|nr:class I tRNA ligase family protein [Candidatus Roizmanbacteria bacterium]